MKINHLESFLILSEEMNYRKAAERLYISQPSLSNQIRALEIEVGCQLFEREKRGIKLTSGGKLLVSKAKEILLKVRETEMHLAIIGGNERSTIKLGVSGYHFIYPILKEFKNNHPQVKISLEEYSSLETKEKLLRGEIDLGIVYLPIGEFDLSYKFLFDEEIIAVIKESGEFSKLTTISLEELSNVPLVVLNSQYFVRNILDTALQKKLLILNLMYEVSSYQSCLDIVKITDSVGIVSKSFFEELDSIGMTKEFKQIKIEDDLSKQKLGLAYRGDIPFDPVLQDFVEMLSHHYSESLT